MKDELIEELRYGSLSFFISKWILERPTPYVFQPDHLLYLDWRSKLAAKLGVDPCSVLVVGSACIGISLNPEKNWKCFDEESDIDVAVVSAVHFDEAWRFLRGLGSERLGYSTKEKEAIQRHRTNLIYQGTIATDLILQILPFGSLWKIALAEMSEFAPTSQHSLNVRIYMDFESLRSYQLHSLEKLRSQLLPLDGDAK